VDAVREAVGPEGVRVGELRRVPVQQQAGGQEHRAGLERVSGEDERARETTHRAMATGRPYDLVHGRFSDLSGQIAMDAGTESDVSEGAVAP
jgi:hypothetical protein